MGLLDSLLSSGTSAQPSPLALGLLGGINSPKPALQTQQQILRQQLMAQQLQGSGSKTGPVGSWAEGAARLADTLAGDRLASQSSDATAASAAHAQSMWGPALGMPSSAPSPLAQGLMGGAAPAVTSGGGQQSADLSGGDPTFGRMIGAESGGQQFGADGAPLTSPKGAVGIAQVMPGTAPEAAQYAGLPFDQAKYQTDPAYNAALGKAYFDHQLQQFGGDPAMAAAAYNAGPGAVQQAVAKAQQGGGSYLDYLPAETQAYVAKVAPGGGQQQAAPSSSAMAYAPPSGGAQPAPGGAMGAIQSAAGPGAGLSQGVQPQATPAPSDAPDPSTGAVPQTQLAMNGSSAPPVSGQAAASPQMQGQRAPIDPQALLRIMTDPYMAPEQQQMAAQMYSTLANRPSFSTFTLPNGTTIQRNSLTGEQSVLQKPDPQRFEDPRTKNTYTYDANNPSSQPRQLNLAGTGAPLNHVLTAPELAAQKLPPDAKVQTGLDGKIEAVPGSEDAFGKGMIGSLSKKYAGMIDAVPAAQKELQDLNGLQGALSRIQSAGGTTGLGSEEKIHLVNAINSAGSMFGMAPVMVNDLSDLEQVKKYGANLSSAMLQSMSAGGSRGGAFVLKSIQAGQPNLDLSTLSNQRLVGMAIQDRLREISVGNQMADQAANDYASGKPANVGAYKKILDDYDASHKVMEPLTGQDISRTANTPGAGQPVGQPGSSAQGMYAPQAGLNYAAPKSREEYDAIPSGQPVKLPSKAAPTGFTYGLKP